jgi:hypothetical protein
LVAAAGSGNTSRRNPLDYRIGIVRRRGVGTSFLAPRITAGQRAEPLGVLVGHVLERWLAALPARHDALAVPIRLVLFVVVTRAETSGAVWFRAA